MRAVVQRVAYSKVTVDGRTVGEIKNGLTVLLGVGIDDNEKDVEYLADKIVNLRVFEDSEGKMNLSLKDVNGDLLAVSQFTLYGDVRRGKRPSFDRAARPDTAKKLYESFVNACLKHGIRVQTGEFQAMMMVEIHNDGPVAILIDSKKEF